MGRGDSRTKRGKIFKASYGNSRKHRVATAKVERKKATTTAAPKKATMPKKSK